MKTPAQAKGTRNKTGLTQSRQDWAQSRRQYTLYGKALSQRHGGFA
jgi:hypothetical protein